MTVEAEVSRHYTRTDLEETLNAALRRSGKDPERLTSIDLAAVDEFHLGWRDQTVAFAQVAGFSPGMTVLDVGSGLGGPARYFAEACGCDVTGIDLTPSFVETATALTRRLGLSDRVRFNTGSALAMPVGDAAFEAATLIHVGMNIPDKAALFAEVRRTLKPGGRFALYEVMRMAEGSLPYPMPWADTEATSFVETPATYRTLLEDAGFAIVHERDRSAFVLEAAQAMRARMEAEGPPELGLHLLIGADAGERVGRLVQFLRQGVLAPVEIVADLR